MISISYLKIKYPEESNFKILTNIAKSSTKWVNNYPLRRTFFEVPIKVSNAVKAFNLNNVICKKYLRL